MSATKTVYVHMRAGETLPDMCPECLFFAIQRFSFAVLCDDGVKTSTRDVCAVCRKRRQDDRL